LPGAAAKAESLAAESTIKTRGSRVLAKTGARDRVHAVIIAYDAGLVRPGGSPEAP
jgi:DNA-binding NarL/FixJ family response regulator